MALPAPSNEDDYILNRDWRAMARLNQRHHLFKLAQGFLLHPDVQLKADAKVAEIGAGTCMWPIDLLHELPFLSVDAVDISRAQCPPRPWLPNNVTLISHDVYQPFPSSMLGVYDLVHVQNWLCIWRDETSDMLISNLIALLSASSQKGSRILAADLFCPVLLIEPGGYLQWNEQDPTANRMIQAPGSMLSTEATQQLLTFLNKPQENMKFEWVSQLGSRLAKDLAFISFNRHKIADEQQAFWSVSVLQFCEEFSSNMRRRAQSREDIAKVKALEDVTERASAELLNGVGIHQELVVAVLQKPQV